MKVPSVSRSIALDVIRCAALLCVVSVHFFLRTGFYEENIVGLQMFFMVCLRTVFMICVPLFLMLSGFLMHSRKPTAGYYKKLIKTIAIYILASVICVLYRNIEGSNPLSLTDSLVGILGFHAISYAWYVEMYIGLFLIIPFLNVLYNHLESKKMKQMLLLSLLVLTALPSVANIWRFLDLQWWLFPAGSDKYYELVPNWWIGFYPITYYFLGCYIQEYPLKIKCSTNLILLILGSFIAGSFSFYRSYGSHFVSGLWQEHGSATITILTVLFFNLMIKLRYDWIPESVARWLARLSDWCFGAYLLSWVFDDFFYRILNNLQPVMLKRMNYFILIVPAVYICSLTLSAAINALWSLVLRLAQNVVSRKAALHK